MKIETKFNIGDVVTYIGDSNVCSGTVTHINIDVDVSEQNSIKYRVNRSLIHETRCFPSLTSLLKHLETSGS